MHTHSTTHIKRTYQKWFSHHLQREMELLVYGDGGSPVILFPTRMAKFYDYEDWGLIDSLESKIASGQVQIFCLSSVDEESFYCKQIHPAERINRHKLFEQYVLFELLPFIKEKNDNPNIIVAGCSFGAYHAVNLAFRYPQLFKKVIGMSGRYDLTIQLEYFNDLFEGFWNEDIYFNMPGQYIHNLNNEAIIKALQNLEIIFARGKEDAFLENNLQLSKGLWDRNIPNIMHTLEGEAHKAKYWGEMLNIYL
jgi:esterase/lipase superfamily enzyme